MKLLSVIAALCAAAALTAAETAVLDANATVKNPSKGTTVNLKDGVLTMSGKSGTAKYNYQFTRVAVTPVVTQGKKFSVTIEPADSFKGDSVYIKGLDAKGKEVFSYVAYALPAEKKTYVLDLGKTTSPFRWLDQQIKSTPETPVAYLQFFHGRATQNSDMKVTFSDIKLVD